MPKGKLSARQEAILEFIAEFFDEQGFPPTIREIGTACNISSTSVVNYNLDKLEREGYLTRSREVSRGLRLIGPLAAPAGLVRVPLVGRIVAGEPAPVPAGDFGILGADEAIELTRDIVTESDDLFALEVKGDSMIDDQIADGDYVVVRKQRTARKGQIVVALTGENEATLKRWHPEKNRIRLEPANSTMKPIYVRNAKVLGVVVGVVRKVG